MRSRAAQGATPLIPALSALSLPSGEGQALSVPSLTGALPAGVKAHCYGSAALIDQLGLEQVKRCLSASHSVTWLDLGEPLDERVRRLSRIKGDAGERFSAELELLLVRERSALPPLLIALICAQVTPLLIVCLPPSVVDRALTRTLSALSPQLSRLCLSAGVSLLCLHEHEGAHEPLDHERSSASELSRFAWSELWL